MNALSWLFYTLSILSSFGAGYTHASVKYHRRMAAGYGALSRMASDGHIPTADEVIAVFGGEPLDHP